MSNWPFETKSALEDIATIPFHCVLPCVCLGPINQIYKYNVTFWGKKGACIAQRMGNSCFYSLINTCVPNVHYSVFVWAFFDVLQWVFSKTENRIKLNYYIWLYPLTNKKLVFGLDFDVLNKIVEFICEKQVSKLMLFQRLHS